MRNAFYGVILASFAAVHATSVAGESWTQFGGPTRVFRFEPPFASNAAAPTKSWQRTVGEGMSGVVVCDEMCYTMYLVPFDADDAEKSESEREHREAIVALDRENGRVRWSYEYAAGWIESQQAFGGRSRAPQATPVVCGEYLLSVGFTGMMHCLNRMTGEVIWQKNFIQAFESVPVQFGFAASPLLLGDRVIVLAGGQRGGLVCLDAKTGSVIWNVACHEASYATPVLWERPDGDQIVFMTRNRIVGVDANAGQTLWDHQLAEQGMTNVPTPMPIDGVSLLISGQGVKGTQRLNVLRTQTKFEVTEAWRSDEQFFYCNWVLREGVLFGCDGSLLIAIDVDTGKTIGRFRGYRDANVLLANDQLLIFDGDGHLSELRIAGQDLVEIAEYAVLDDRCWTPPTPVGTCLYCRGGDQLVCLDLNGGDPLTAVPTARATKRVLTLQTDGIKGGADPMQEILTAYETGGADAAWKVYDVIRKRDSKSLSFEDRLRLAKLAADEGLADFAQSIQQHAAEDFPEEANKAH